MDAVPFHSLVRRWFVETFPSPTPPQTQGWSAIATGEHALIAAPTGSGKTLAAFLWALNGLVESAVAGTLDDRVRLVYVSPLKALGNDIEKNLQLPLAGIRRIAAEAAVELPEIRVAVRSGDTPARERELQARRPPHILITTPESLYILLTAGRSREALRQAETVIVDEIHAVAADKRGSHLALSLERLDALAGRRLQRIGLSATQKPIEEIARLLGGERAIGSLIPEADSGTAAVTGEKLPYPSSCRIIDVGHRRRLDLSVWTPTIELGPITSHELRADVYDRLAELVRSHRTTIVFVNTRRLVERVAHALSERLGDDQVAAHHGSLSRETRIRAEHGLKSGAVPVVVATASLELGIDVGHVDLVCHLGAPRSIATLLQRVGRSGHFLGATPKGIIFPLTRDDLVQSAAAVRAVRQGELDRVTIPRNTLDVLAQQIVATVASEEIAVEELWALVRRAYPFETLARHEFESLLEMLSEGVSTRRGRRSAHLHYDRVNGRLRPRRGARLAAITSGGAIPDTADYDVVEDPDAAFVGKVNEDFAVESLAGDIFLLGNRSWRIRRVEAGRIRVSDAQGAPPTIPFWLGESPGRTPELSAAVAALRLEVAERRTDRAAAISWLVSECGVDEAGAEQIVGYVDETVRFLGAVPTQDTIIAERFFDEAGGMQLVVHAPFGGRINRAFGLALRKRFCVSFDFELQAAATDDGIVISLGEQHSFPLETVFSMVRSRTFEDDLVQAALRAPMFTNRWRWNASRALVLLRFTGGRRVPMPIQRMRAEDLLAAVFPAQLACADNGGTGPVEPPDHPLVQETIRNCLHEAMDTNGLRTVVERIERGEIRTLAVETPAPSPMSHEILNANPYAFLDDAPLEERRARAVSLRRVDPDLATGIGALDPAAIEEVRRQAWPEPRDPDEAHDALLTLGMIPEDETGGWSDRLDVLLAEQRATRVRTGSRGKVSFVAAERIPLVRVGFSDAELLPNIPVPALPRRCAAPEDPDAAVGEIVRGWMDSIGPTTAGRLSERLGIPRERVETALARLEMDGTILRGSFSGDAEPEWCERGLLARIHRLTIGRLRREIEPVSAADFLRFLFRWQHLQPGTQLHGRDGLLEVIRQLQGLELPGPSWERDVFPARVAEYDPRDLEQLCLAGEVVWGRLAITRATDDEAPPARRSGPTRSAPLAFALRSELPALLEPPPQDQDWLDAVSPIAAEVYRHLAERGASFLADIARAIRRLPTEVEDALWELVASGLVTGDGIAGLRTLLLPEDKRRPRRPTLRLATHLRPVRDRRSQRLMPVGRWALLRSPESGSERTPEDLAETVARRLLDRYGVVLREICARERRLPPWRSLLGSLRRLEARGEVRGGRFVAGFVGEQFALPEAVEALRATRRRGESAELLIVSAADPLNLVGILTPGGRVSPFSGQVIAYRDGVPVDVGELGHVTSRLRQLRDHV